MQRLLISILSATTLFAAEPWVGTWKYIPAKTKATQILDMVCEEQPNGYRFVVEGGAQAPISAILDGKDYPRSNPTPLADTENWRRIDERSIEQSFKKNGKVTSTTHRVVSSDGKQFTQTLESTAPDGKQIHSVFVYDRVTAGSSSDPFLGKWRYDPSKTATNALLTIEQTDQGILFKVATGQNYELTSDGHAHPISNGSGSAKLKHMDKNGFDFVRIDSNGKETTSSRIEVVDQNTLRFINEMKRADGQIIKSEDILERQ